MANPVWPTTLPNPDYGWSEAEVDGMFIRSASDAGVAKQRLRYTAVAVPVTANMTLSKTQYAIFRNFVETTLKYVMPFDWVDMMDDVTVRTYRFTKKPTATRSNFGQIVVGLALERMP